jgi:hypothetical protein
VPPYWLPARARERVGLRGCRFPRARTRRPRRRRPGRTERPSVLRSRAVHRVPLCDSHTRGGVVTGLARAKGFGNCWTACRISAAPAHASPSPSRPSARRCGSWLQDGENPKNHATSAGCAHSSVSISYTGVCFKDSRRGARRLQQAAQKRCAMWQETGVAPPSDPSGDTIFGKILRGEIPCNKVYEGARHNLCCRLSPVAHVTLHHKPGTLNPKP